MNARTKPALHVVDKADPKTEIVVDIYAADKAKIAATDWARLHIRGDRSPSIYLPDRVRRLAIGAGLRRSRGGLLRESRF